MLKTCLLVAFLSSAAALCCASAVQAQTPARASDSSSGASTQPVIHAGQKLAFLGASITEFGWSHPGGYVKLAVDTLAANGVAIVPIPAGVRGNTSRDMLARLENDVINRKPDWVTIDAGGNDVWHGQVDFAEYMANMTTIVDKAQGAGIHVVIQTCTPIGEDLNNEFNPKMAYYNAFLRYLAAQKHCLLCDLNAEFLLQLKAKTHPDNLLTTDGVHMNDAGNRVMARGLLQTLGLTSAQINKTLFPAP